jgi:membrane protein DedA with SNARE-associated domain
MVLENMFPPIPSELIVPLAGFVSSQGEITLTGVIIAGTLGSLVGAMLLYYGGRLAGGPRLRRWSAKHGRWIGLTPDDLEKSDRWFKRYGGWTVLFGRLIPGVRSLISVPAGAARMSVPVFLIFTTVGSAVWTTALACAGRALGRNYDRVEKFLGPISMGVVVTLLALWIIRAVRQGRNHSRRTAR